MSKINFEPTYLFLKLPQHYLGLIFDEVLGRLGVLSVLIEDSDAVSARATRHLSGHRLSVGLCHVKAVKLMEVL